MTSDKGGQPAYYKTPEEMQIRVDLYFRICKHNKDPEEGMLADLSKDDMKIAQEIDNKRPTVTGLALALGFTSRQALLNYQNTEEFFDTVRKAKSKIEAYVEEQLFESNPSGVKFSLTNNFKWEEKITQDVNQRYVDKQGEDLSNSDKKILDEYNQKILTRGKDNG